MSGCTYVTVRDLILKAKLVLDFKVGSESVRDVLGSQSLRLSKNGNFHDGVIPGDLDSRLVLLDVATESLTNALEGFFFRCLEEAMQREWSPRPTDKTIDS